MDKEKENKKTESEECEERYNSLKELEQYPGGIDGGVVYKEDLLEELSYRLRITDCVKLYNNSIILNYAIQVLHNTPDKALFTMYNNTFKKLGEKTEKIYGNMEETVVEKMSELCDAWDIIKEVDNCIKTEEIKSLIDDIQKEYTDENISRLQFVHLIDRTIIEISSSQFIFFMQKLSRLRKNKDLEASVNLHDTVKVLQEMKENEYFLKTMEEIKNGTSDTYKALLFEIDAMSYKSIDEKLAFSEWKEMNDRLQKAYDDNLITKQQTVHLIALMTNYHCVEG